MFLLKNQKQIQKTFYRYLGFMMIPSLLRLMCSTCAKPVEASLITPSCECMSKALQSVAGRGGAEGRQLTAAESREDETSAVTADSALI